MDRFEVRCNIDKCDQVYYDINVFKSHLTNIHTPNEVAAYFAELKWNIHRKIHQINEHIEKRRIQPVMDNGISIAYWYTAERLRELLEVRIR